MVFGRDSYEVDAGSVRLEPKAVAAAAHAHESGTALTPDDFSGGQTAANAAIRRTGATVLDTHRLAVDDELAWRLEEWAKIGGRQAEGEDVPVAVELR